MLALFLSFKTTCESNGTHEGAAMLLPPHFTKEPAKGALSYRMCATKKSITHKEGTLTTYCQVVNYLLETSATDDVVSEVDADNMDNKQLENISTECYSQRLWEKALRYGRVYKKSKQNGLRAHSATIALVPLLYRSFLGHKQRSYIT